MANRNTLAISKLEEFKGWLISQGFKPLKPKGIYEVLRWKSEEKGEAMPVVFQKDSATVHLTLNESAKRFVRVWLRSKKEMTDTVIQGENKVKKLSEKMIKAFEDCSYFVLFDSFVSDTQKLEQEIEALKAEISKQDDEIVELVEAIEDCGVDVDEILEAKRGE